VSPAARDELDRPSRAGLLLETLDPEGVAAGVANSRAGGQDVTVAGGGPGRLDAEGDDVARAGAFGRGRKGRAEAGLVGDGLVRVEADHDLVAGSLDGMRSKGHGGRGVAAQRLAHDVAAGPRHGLRTSGA
jgi:hypothetical protein